jgi:hypothetical protein
MRLGVKAEVRLSHTRNLASVEAGRAEFNH